MRDDLPVSGDLVRGQVADWLVTGWFTEDDTYRPLAEAFAANLTEHGVPFHLWAKTKTGPGWSTRQKPSVVLDTLDAYPGKTVVLMDVDCIVRGGIEPVTRFDGDVGVALIARNVPGRDGFRHWLAFEASSRVVVFKPTEGAKAFAMRWAAQIASSSVDHDEHSMAWAFLKSPTVNFAYIDQKYSAREIGQIPDAVIAHDSAHDKQRKRERGGIKEMLRAIERPFRTGRTKVRKLQGELSVLVKAG